MAVSTRLSHFLEEGALHMPSDMHTRTGYPVWQLIDVWYARGTSDARVIAEYSLDPLEWAAAKDYYFKHQSEIDARRILNDEEPSIPVPGAVTLEDLLAEQSGKHEA